MKIDAESTERDQGDGIRVISWNIEKGGGECAQDQVEALLNQHPHIIALQELRKKTMPLYQSAFRDAGYKVLTTFDSAEYGLPNPDMSHNGLLLASVLPIKEPRLVGIRLPSLNPPPAMWREQREACFPDKDFCLSVTMQYQGLEVDFYNAHMPHGISDTDPLIKLKKVVAYYSLYEELRPASPRARILCGDLNSPWDERGKSVKMCYEHTGPGSRWAVENRHVVSAERAVICGLREFGWFDAFRQLYDYGSHEQEAFSMVFLERGLPIGRRLDHIYAYGALRPRACRYLHRVDDLQLRKDIGGRRSKGNRASGLSDHAPVEATLAVADASSRVVPRRCPA